MDDPSPFERAFIATSYLLGRRGTELADAMEEAPSDGSRKLVARLMDASRENRALALAPELARLITALESRRLG
jgi:hypothetical protein